MLKWRGHATHAYNIWTTHAVVNVVKLGRLQKITTTATLLTPDAETP